MTLTDYMLQEKWEEDVSIEDSVNASIQRLGDFTEKRGAILITVTRKNSDDTRISRTEINRKQKCKEEGLFGCFKRLTSYLSHEKI